MRVRAKAVSVSTATNWLFNFALAWAVPPGLSSIAYKTYFIFGTFNFAAFVHIFFCFPETAGRTLEEIEEVFDQGHMFTAWKIERHVGKKTLEDVVNKKQTDSVGPSCILFMLQVDANWDDSFFFFNSTMITIARTRRHKVQSPVAVVPASCLTFCFFISYDLPQSSIVPSSLYTTIVVMSLLRGLRLRRSCDSYSPRLVLKDEFICR